MHVTLQNINYHTDGGMPILSNINLTINKNQKTAIVGSNGAGKSTLLKIITGDLKSYKGETIVEGSVYFVPQHYGQYSEQKVAEALKIEHYLKALNAIENGSTDQANYEILDNNWDLRARTEAALIHWCLSPALLNNSMN
ncbi:MAG: ATP-binding cassette domain-containing protein, partial [Chitinophagaceae bacterium]